MREDDPASAAGDPGLQARSIPGASSSRSARSSMTGTSPATRSPGERAPPRSSRSKTSLRSRAGAPTRWPATRATGPTRHEAVLHGDTQDCGSGVPFRLVYQLRLPDGRTLPVEDTGRWYAGAGGRAALAHGVLRIGRSIEAAPVPSSRERSDLLERLGREVAASLRARRSLGLLLFSIEDLDRFNEDLGLDGADRVIEEVLRRTRGIMRRRDFLVAAPETDSPWGFLPAPPGRPRPRPNA
jgi:hypothetical protein